MKTQPINKNKSDIIALIAFAVVIFFCLFGESLIDGLLKLIYNL